MENHHWQSPLRSCYAITALPSNQLHMCVHIDVLFLLSPFTLLFYFFPSASSLPSTPPFLSFSLLLERQSLACNCIGPYYCNENSSCVTQLEDKTTVYDDDPYQELFCIISKEFHASGLEIVGARCHNANAFDSNFYCERTEMVSICINVHVASFYVCLRHTHTHTHTHNWAWYIFIHTWYKSVLFKATLHVVWHRCIASQGVLMFQGKQ